MKVYVVEIESGSSYDDESTLVYDSVWSSREKAEEYCKKFHPDTGIGGFIGDGWYFEIYETELDKGN